MKKIKILQIVPSLGLANGVAAYLNNYYENMDLSKYETTILVLNNDDKERYNFFKEKGCIIVEFYKESSWFAYLKKINDFFSTNYFDVVHCHAANYGAFFMYYAKKYNVSLRIIHSHANRSADKVSHAIRNSFLIPIAVKNSNKYIACSNDAGKFMFKKKKYSILNNAINLEKFKFNFEDRNEIRNQLNLNGKFVVGSFGRFCPQKNQLFTLEVFDKILDKNKETILLLIGTGEQKEVIEKKAKKMGIYEKIIILNSKKDINRYYNCLDIFLLPSTYEGLGIVLIEAQTNNLKCYTSKYKVPTIAKVSPLLEFIELKNNASEWSKIITNNDNKREDYFIDISKSSYNIINEANKLEEIYNSIIND